MPAQINIVTVVDVVGALASESLDGNIHLIDNSRSSTTTGQGTAELSTTCKHGQVINWLIYAVDLQSPALIHNIDFEGSVNPCLKLQPYGAPVFGPYWAGIVKLEADLKSGVYPYRLEIEMAGRTMTMNQTPALNIVKERTLKGSGSAYFDSFSMAKAGNQ